MRMPRRRSASGFTLIEVLLALALFAGLLLAMNQFVFAITDAWAHSQDRLVFARHARAVTEHVEDLLAGSADRARASNSPTVAPAFAEVRLPQGAGTAPLLTFDLPQGDRLFTWPAAPLPEVWCALGWNADEGLVLYWKSRLEEDFATADPRHVTLSPFVTSVSYDYYDDQAGTWSEKTEPQAGDNGTYLAPRRLRLHFARGGQQIEEVVWLPAATVEGVALD